MDVIEIIEFLDEIEEAVEIDETINMRILADKSNLLEVYSSIEFQRLTSYRYKLLYYNFFVINNRSFFQ